MANVNWGLLGFAATLGAIAYYVHKSRTQTFIIGQRVALKENHNITGTIRSVLPQADGSIWYEVIWDTDFFVNPIEGKFLVAI